MSLFLMVQDGPSFTALRWLYYLKLLILVPMIYGLTRSCFNDCYILQKFNYMASSYLL